MLKNKFTQLLILAILFTYSAISNAEISLNENCSVNILNRTIQVAPDGSWQMPNVPSFMGSIKARATCLVNGETVSGESNYFTIQPGVTNIIDAIRFVDPEPAPTSLTFVNGSSAVVDLTSASLQLAVIASYSEKADADITTSTGINFFSSNTDIANVSSNGLVTFNSAGSILITARIDGVLALKKILISSSADADLDGIPDGYEVLNGLDPNDPIDAQEDRDRDGLSALQEYHEGTDLNNPDTDADGIEDGEELIAGDDGFVTNPLLFDTDGDGLNDGLEVLIGSNPTDPASGNLADALDAISTQPLSLDLTYNAIDGEVSKMISVTGHLIDGGEIDITSKSTGTSYASDNIAIANFGLQDGEIFGSQSGSTLIRIANNTFTTDLPVTVDAFSPTAQGFIDLTGPPQNVDAQGDIAYVAAGTAGLHIVDVSNRATPVLIQTIAIPGFANDVKVQGNYAYVAGREKGLSILDVTDPYNAVILATVDTRDAQDIDVAGNYVYIADGTGGMAIVNITNPESAFLQSQLNGFSANGIAVDGSLAAVVSQQTLFTIDVSDTFNPVRLGGVNVVVSSDVALSNGYAHVASHTSGYQIYDVNIPATPQLVGTLVNFYPFDVVLSGDGLAFFAEQLFVSAAPYVNTTDPANPVYQGFIDFSQYRDDDGNGLDIDSQYVYMTTAKGRLYIGQYRKFNDDQGIAPSVALIEPVSSAEAYQGGQLNLKADASDDFFVAEVNFEVNEQIVFTDNIAPYEFTYRVPTTATNLTVRASALDTAGNTGYSDSILIDVLPDPGTTIKGIVVNESGGLLEAANVNCIGLSTTTLADGSFSIENAPTAQGDIVCKVSYANSEGVRANGRSNIFTPVASGITDIGTIKLVPAYILFDTFDTRDSNNWFFNGFQIIPYNLNGENVLKMTSDRFNRPMHTISKLVDGQELMLDFYYSRSGEHELKIETAYNRFALTDFRGRFVVHSIINGTSRFNKTLVSSPQYGSWYSALFRVDDAGQFYMKVWERDNPSVSNDFYLDMPNGLGWQFSFSKNTSSTIYLDNVRIYNTGAFAPETTIGNLPDSGEFIQGSTVTLRADVQSEQPVLSVQLLINGVGHSTDTSFPYEFDYVVPIGATSVNVSFVVTDVLGAQTTSAVSQVNIVPDAGTSVTGRVIDGNAATISGASVNCNNILSTSDATGLFTISLASSLNDVVCTVSVDLGGVPNHGETIPFTALNNGITDVGDVMVSVL